MGEVPLPTTGEKAYSTLLTLTYSYSRAPHETTTFVVSNVDLHNLLPLGGQKSWGISETKGGWGGALLSQPWHSALQLTHTGTGCALPRDEKRDRYEKGKRHQRAKVKIGAVNQ